MGTRVPGCSPQIDLFDQPGAAAHCIVVTITIASPAPICRGPPAPSPPPDIIMPVITLLSPGCGRTRGTAGSTARLARRAARGPARSARPRRLDARTAARVPALLGRGAAEPRWGSPGAARPPAHQPRTADGAQDRLEGREADVRHGGEIEAQQLGLPGQQVEDSPPPQDWILISTHV